MNKKFLKLIYNLLAVAVIGIGFIPQNLKACSRVLYTGDDGLLVMTGRTTDWESNVDTNIWSFPRGLAKNGSVGKNSIKWTSKYGSIVSTAHDMFTLDGMNEKGLVVNLLYLKETEYAKPKKNDRRKLLLVSAWGQYFLDNFANVNEAVIAMKKEPFYVVPFEIESNSTRTSGLHLAISDSTGDSAIFEYIDGKLQIHHGKQYKVLTNSPIFNDQLAINDYWNKVGGTVFLPGTNKPTDRFVRGSFYTDVVEKTSNPKIGLAVVLSVIRNLSVPIGMSTPDIPNISATRWRAVSDQTNKKYYFESVFEQNGFWIDLKDMNFEKGQPIKKLTLTDGRYYTGNASKDFETVELFSFIPDTNLLKIKPANE